MKKTIATLCVVAAVCLTALNWSHTAADSNTAKAVTPLVVPVTTKAPNRHIVAKQQVAIETEEALKPFGLSMENTFGVAAESKTKSQSQR